MNTICYKLPAFTNKPTINSCFFRVLSCNFVAKSIIISVCSSAALKINTAALCLLLVTPMAALTGDGPQTTSPAPEASVLDHFSSEQRQKLMAGEAVFEHVESKEPDGSTQGHGQASALIKAPAAECLRLFCEFDKHYQFFPRNKTSEVVESSATKVLVRKVYTFYMMNVEYTIAYSIDPGACRVDYHLDLSCPHDIDDAAGFFHFEKIDDRRTLLTYAATRVDTGIKVPAFIRKYVTTRDLPAVVMNVKKRIESGGKWTTED